ncbi:hypothetical protein BH23GEM11_BH23GEM11_10370 [soil metagenome]
MKPSVLPGLCALALVALVAGCTETAPAPPGSADPGTPTAFRVRADMAAGLNADRGWAGGVNENVTVFADQPFRLRFETSGVPEAAGTEGSGARGDYGLQVRRNQGEWTDLELHDFPYPLRIHDLDFGGDPVGASPPGWTVVQGDPAGVAVRENGGQRILGAEAGPEPLLALYRPPWALDAFSFATEFRLPAGSEAGVALVFGHVDAENHYRVVLDPGAGAIRVLRLVDGEATILAEERAGVVAGEWLEVEIQLENGELEVNFQDDTLEFTVPVGTEVPVSWLGFRVPPGGTGGTGGTGSTGAEFRGFNIEGEPSSPRVSLVECAPCEVAAGGAGAAHAQGGAGAAAAVEFGLVVRRLADRAVTNEEGDTFEFRMVRADGTPLGGASNPVLSLAIPPGHLGGTFVETPGRIGPWQAASGDLYFVMEPSESDNLFMMVKSSDNGRTWIEVDGANRPQTGDLESVDGRQVGGTIHIVHQVTEAGLYHVFHTSDHPTRPDTWDVRDEVAGEVEAVSQMATLEVRSDGSLVAFYLGAARLHYSVRAPEGGWSEVRSLGPDVAPGHGGPQAVLGENDTVHLAWYGTDGTIWYRRFLPDNTLTPRLQLASGAGTSEDEFGAVLPLAWIPESNTAVVVYRLASGELWERRIVNDGPPSPAARVTDRRVITNAVDSQQPAADVMVDGETVHVLFIEESSRSIFSTHDRGGWQPPTLEVDDILGSWVRGSVYTRPDGIRVYGFVYDAGSFGGAGMNRFAEIVLGER